MKTSTLKYFFLLFLFFETLSLSYAQYDYPSRKDVSFDGKLINMQKHFTEYINKTGNNYFIKVRQLSLEGMRLNDKMENRKAIACYIQAELLLIEIKNNSDIKDLLLADILQNKGRAYHYVGNRDIGVDFIIESKKINEALIKRPRAEIARFAYFFLATNYDMLNNGYGGYSGLESGYAAVKIKRDILKIHGAETGRSYWNYSTHFSDRPASKNIETDTMIRFSRLAEKEFEMDGGMDRIYNGEFISTNKVMLARRYMNFYHNVDSCKFYSEKTIASLSVTNRYKFPDDLPVFLDYEEMMRSSRPLSECLEFIYDQTKDKRYLKIARDLLDSAVSRLSKFTAETFNQGNRNIGEMNITNRFVINALAAGETFPMKSKTCFGFLSEIERVRSFNYQKIMLENHIADSVSNLQILTIRKLNSQYLQLEENRITLNHVNYLRQNLNLLLAIDSLEKCNYKEEILQSISYSSFNSEIRNICTLLDPSTTILLYYCDDFVNLCVSISSTGVIIHKITLENENKRDIEILQSLFESQTKLDSNWCKLSNNVYKKLVQPFVNMVNTRELTIIPSGILNRVPFESMVTSYSKNHEGKLQANYLMQDVTIHYEYSLKSFYKRVNKEESTKVEKVYAFAPKYEILAVPGKKFIASAKKNTMKSNLRSQAYPLKYNVPEALTVAGHDGFTFVNQDATELKFRQVGDTADVLHLAMHSYFNNNPMYCGLVFTKNNPVSDFNTSKTNKDTISWIDDGILYAYEIYQMRLKSDLAVLSACETGLGGDEAGEGTRSLGLAFRYAGCHNTVMSLWSVDDLYTQELMESFYNYLRQGKPKAEALTCAKRDFVCSHKTAGPFFWSGFILYGDNEPVNLKKQSNISIFLVIGLMATLLIGFEIRRRGKIKKSLI